MKEDYQKALRKVTLFFLSNPVPLNGQSYQKQKGSVTSDQSLFKKKVGLQVTKQVQKYSSMRFVSFDQV